MIVRSFDSLTDAARWFEDWLREAALPLWATRGVDPASGGFREALSLAGEGVPAPRRARAQARQVWVYATATAAGLGRPWLEVARRGFEAFIVRYRRPDQLFARLADEDGRILDDTPMLYDQAFALLATAALHQADPTHAAQSQAEATRHGLSALRHAKGGWRETSGEPFQANAHMHLLEATLAWEERGDASWGEMSDEIIDLALNRFIDPAGGYLREFFDAAWGPLSERDGGVVEPGHQFEWAWLLDRWGRLRGHSPAQEAARRLYSVGLRGVDRARGVAVAALWEDLSLRDPLARLWPQTERLKAALLFDDDAEVLAAAGALATYLDAPARGVWRDKLLADGGFVDEPAPATSFYHILGALLLLQQRVGPLAPGSQP
jgi:mannose-1-phosphate guanylyltransferase/mannose-6-phosphate isomerase